MLTMKIEAEDKGTIWATITKICIPDVTCQPAIVEFSDEDGFEEAKLDMVAEKIKLIRVYLGGSLVDWISADDDWQFTTKKLDDLVQAKEFKKLVDDVNNSVQMP